MHSHTMSNQSIYEENIAHSSETSEMFIHVIWLTSFYKIADVYFDKISQYSLQSIIINVILLLPSKSIINKREEIQANIAGAERHTNKRWTEYRCRAILLSIIFRFLISV